MGARAGRSSGKSAGPRGSAVRDASGRGFRPFGRGRCRDSGHDSDARDDRTGDPPAAGGRGIEPEGISYAYGRRLESGGSLQPAAPVDRSRAAHFFERRMDRQAAPTSECTQLARAGVPALLQSYLLSAVMPPPTGLRSALIFFVCKAFCTQSSAVWMSFLYWSESSSRSARSRTRRFMYAMASSYSLSISRAFSRFFMPSLRTGSHWAFSSSLTFLSLIGPGSSGFMPSLARADP